MEVITVVLLIAVVAVVGSFVWLGRKKDEEPDEVKLSDEAKKVVSEVERQVAPQVTEPVTEEETITRSDLENMTKSEIKAYADSNAIEVSISHLKSKMIEDVIQQEMDTTLFERMSKKASRYELDQAAFKSEILGSKAAKTEWKEFLKSANINKMVEYYSDDALFRVRESGSNHNFKDMPEVYKAILDAVAQEESIRNPTVAPKGHGMGPDGRPQ